MNSTELKEKLDNREKGLFRAMTNEESINRYMKNIDTLIENSLKDCYDTKTAHGDFTNTTIYEGLAVMKKYFDRGIMVVARKSSTIKDSVRFRVYYDDKSFEMIKSFKGDFALYCAYLQKKATENLQDELDYPQHIVEYLNGGKTKWYKLKLHMLTTTLSQWLIRY